MLSCISLEIGQSPVHGSAEQWHATDRVVESGDTFLELREQADVRRLEEKLWLCEGNGTLVAANSLSQALVVTK